MYFLSDEQRLALADAGIRGEAEQHRFASSFFSATGTTPRAMPEFICERLRDAGVTGRQKQLDYFRIFKVSVTHQNDSQT